MSGGHLGLQMNLKPMTLQIKVVLHSIPVTHMKVWHTKLDKRREDSAIAETSHSGKACMGGPLVRDT